MDVYTDVRRGVGVVDVHWLGGYRCVFVRGEGRERCVHVGGRGSACTFVFCMCVTGGLDVYIYEAFIVLSSL